MDFVNKKKLDPRQIRDRRSPLPGLLNTIDKPRYDPKNPVQRAAQRKLDQSRRLAIKSSRRRT